ncbi:uncharacterized protein K02A2.6-like [Eupeodes corollae]|uniref:uncharacterized protein K02A2.6-like n=1 Tax=Eupeodes corollae TaxID=290404 RepID=UPI0024903927|nr:uncharacterized protein K02A2.6-like [Eupeodes corollae]
MKGKKGDTEHVQEIDSVLTVGEIRQVGSKWEIFVNLNNHKVKFLLDTGASCSLIGLSGYEEINKPPLNETSRTLRSYGNTTVPVLGELHVNVEFGGHHKQLTLLVADVPSGHNIFGLDWFSAFGLEIKSPSENIVLNLNSDKDHEIQNLFSKHVKVASKTLGLCNSMKAHLYLKPNTKPKFHKARPIPFALMDAFKGEAKRLEEAGVWKPVRFSEWAAPIVVVSKRNKGLRICGDFKVTINPHLEVDQYPIPRPEDLFNKLAGGQRFSKIDLADAYLQIELDEDSKSLTVVNTPLGLYMYQRLPFGVSSAPAIYQKTLEQVLSGLNCAIYLDDIY